MRVLYACSREKFYYANSCMFRSMHIQRGGGGFLNITSTYQHTNTLGMCFWRHVNLSFTPVYLYLKQNHSSLQSIDPLESERSISIIRHYNTLSEKHCYLTMYVLILHCTWLWHVWNKGICYLLKTMAHNDCWKPAYVLLTSWKAWQICSLYRRRKLKSTDHKANDY